MKLTKQDIEKNIIRAIQEAEENGYQVVVASDEEGNSYNILNSKDMLYSDTKKNKIALAVYGYVDDSTIFEGMDGDIMENYQKKAESRLSAK